jgi:hypothetical protein
MKTSSYPTVVLAWLASTVLLTGIAPSALAQPPSAPPSEEPKESVDVHYARASLRLAQMDLQKALDINKKIGRVLPPYAIESLRAVVNIAERQLEYALHKDAESLHQIHVAIAEAKRTAAEAQLQLALAVNKQTSGLYDDTEIERLRLAAEVARLGLEQARSVDVHSHVEHLQWQVGELQKEVLQLQSHVARLSVRD